MSTNVLNIFPERLRRYYSSAFGFRVSALIVFPGVNPKPNPRLSLGLGLGLASGYFQKKYFFVYPSFKDFSLNFYEDTNLLHLVLDSQRLSFSQELTPTLTLGLSLGLGLELALGHFQKEKIYVYTSFKDFSLNVYEDTNLLHLFSGFQHLSFS